MINLKELVTFALKLGELISSVADGVSFDDISKLINVARIAGPAFKDAKLALGEYAGMTDAQAVELEQYVVDNFDISDDKVELAIEAGLKVAIQLHELAKLLVPKA